MITIRSHLPVSFSHTCHDFSSSFPTRIPRLAGPFGGPVAPVVLAGLRPAAKEEDMSWRGDRAAPPAHILRLSDPHAGREHIRHSMQFKKTKKPCLDRPLLWTTRHHSAHERADRPIMKPLGMVNVSFYRANEQWVPLFRLSVRAGLHSHCAEE
jgi:hypothetical protein